MADLFSLGIANLCLSLAAGGQYNQACNKAVDAGTRQMGVRQQVDAAEDGTRQYVTAKVNSEAEKNLGKGAVSVIGAGFFIYRVERDKSLTFRLPTLGLADSVSNQITPTSYTINFKWNIQ